jgi:hypothetical protein
MDLRNRRVLNLDQTCGLHIGQEGHHVAITCFFVNRVPAQNDLAKVFDAARFLEGSPDERANLVDAVVHTRVQIQYHGFSRQVARKLVWYSLYGRHVCEFSVQSGLTFLSSFLFEALSKIPLKKRQNGSRPYSHTRRNGRTKYRTADKRPGNGNASRSREVGTM